MNKTTLSELAVYSGNLELPKGLEFNSESLRADIIDYHTSDKPFAYSRNLDILDKYIQDYFNLHHKKFLIRREVSGLVIGKDVQTENMIEADPMNLKDATDFVLLYGVKIKKDSCNIVLEYDDNRIKNRWHNKEFHENSYMIFPSTTIYRIAKNESSLTNYILKISYESK
jgi:hypothetical protein